MIKILITFIFLISNIKANDNIGYLTNQKYVCMSTQALIGKELMNYQTEEQALKYPQRFYIDDKNILHTDGKMDNIFIHKENMTYESKDSIIVLEIQNNIRYLYRISLTGETKGVAFIFKCVETNNWTIGR